MTGEPGEHTSIHIGGSVAGQVNVGDGNMLHWQHIQQAGAVTAADLADLRAAIAELRTTLAAEPHEATDQAAAKLDEFEEALTGGQVDLPAVEQVHGWFRRTLPAFGAALNRIVFGPIVAKLVAAGGDQLAAEFARRFGG